MIFLCLIVLLVVGISSSVLADESVSAISFNDDVTGVVPVAGEQSFSTLNSKISGATGTLELGNVTYLATAANQGPIVINKDLIIYGGSASDNKMATIDGATLTQLLSIGANKKVTLVDINLINGKSETGGAIFMNNGAELKLINCNFIKNTASSGSADGGAIYGGDNVILNITNCKFIDNEASGSAGGVTDIDAAGGAIFINQDGHVYIDKSKFIGNKATKHGGAICLGTDTLITAKNSEFINSSSANTFGGALFVNDGEIYNCTFTNNTVSGTYSAGGAIAISQLSKLRVDNSRFTNNAAITNEGGAIYGGESQTSTVNLTNSNFTNNRARNGGAVSIQNMHVSNCLFEYNEARNVGAAIRSNNDGFINVTNSTFKYNKATKNGGAVAGQTMSKVFVEDCTFVENTAEQAGAIYANYDTVASVINSTFIKNSALNEDMYSGGAIYINDNATMVIENSTFKLNNAAKGGAVAGEENSKVNVKNCNFTQGSVSNWGGAISGSDNSIITVSESIFTNNSALRGGVVSGDTNSKIKITNSNFTDNKATSYGGVISANEEALINVSNCKFDNNTAQGGGAIYSDVQASVTIFDSNFTKNKVEKGAGDTSGYGGAVLLETGAKALFNNVLFNDNSAVRGGAIDGYVDSNLTIVNSTFISNKASEYSGAIGGANRSYFNVTNSIFANNSAKSGGAIRGDSNATILIDNCSFVNNTATEYGGAVTSAYDAVINITDSTFDKNKATLNGGAIRGDLNAIINIVNSTFVNNTALGGGAIAGNQHANISVVNSIFNDNNASNGGVIRGDVNSTVSVKNSTFVNNTAFEYGGAIAVYGNSTMKISNSNFTNLTSNGGGAIYGDTNSTVEVVNSIFNFNHAYNDPAEVIQSGYGGVILLESNSTAFVDKSLFINNSAVQGGAIRAGSNSTIVIDNCTLYNNSASEFGGAIASSESTIKVIDSKLEKNVAVENGGAIRGDKNATIILDKSTFFNNTASEFGGAIAAYDDVYVEATKSTFTNNVAHDFGSSIAVFENAVLNITGSTFEKNNATRGGAISGQSNSTIIVNHTSFKDNTATVYGGAISGNQSTIKAYNSEFVNNNATNGGAICGDLNSTIVLVNSNFTNNQAITSGGAVAGISNGTIQVTGSKFENNIATKGGAISGDSNSSMKIDTTKFINNTASDNGGAIVGSQNVIINVSGSNFKNNTAIKNGGAISTDINSAVKLDDSTFVNNTARENGGAIAASKNTIISALDSTFESNSAQYGGAVYALGGSNVSGSNFKNNTANKFGSAIYNNGGMNLTDTTFDERASEGYAAVYLNASENGKVNLTQNTITSDLIPIFNNGSVIVSTTNLVIIGNATRDLDRNGKINLTAKLTDDNNNVVGSSVPVTFKVVDANGTEDTFEAKFNATTGNYTYNDYTVPKKGKFIVTASYPGATNLAIENGTISVSLTPTLINITVDDKKFNQTINGTISLEDADGNKLTANVTVTIGNWSKVVKVVDGKGNFTVNKTLSLGEHLAKVEFAGNTTYIGSENTTTFRVSGSNTNVTISINNTVYGKNVTGNVTLKEADGTNIDGNVTVSIGDWNTTVKVVNGTGNFTVDKILDAGDYVATVKFNATAVHGESENTTTFNISKLDTIVSVEVVNTTVNSKINGTVNLTDANGNKLNGTVIVTIDGDDIEVNVVNGTGNFTVVKALGANNYTAKANFATTNNYNASNATVNFTISKLATKLNITVSNTTYGSDVNGTVNLTDANGNKLNATLIVKINGTDVTVSVVNGTGNFTVSNIDAGNYTANVTFEGNASYIASNATVNFTVDQMATNVNVTVSNINVGDNIVGNVTLVDANGNPIDGEVTISVNDTAISETINVVDGQAKFNITNSLSNGTYTLNVTFAGNNNYKSSKNDTEFNVTKVGATVSVNVPNYFVGDVINGTITLVDANGNPIDGDVNVTIGNWSEIVSVVNGTGNFTVNEVLPADNYTVKANFTGTAKYEASNATNTFNISRMDTNVTISIPNFDVGDNVTGTINLTDINGKPISANVTVSISNSTGVVKNITVEVINGTATFDIPEGLNATEYNATVVFNETLKYNASNNRTEFNVTQVSTNIIVKVPDFIGGDETFGTVNLTDKYGNKLSGKVNVTIKCNDTEWNILVNVTNGTGSFNVTNATLGKYNVTVVYNGTNRFIKSENTTKFEVKQLAAEVSIEILDAHVGDNVTVNVTLTDNVKRPLSDNVTVYINNGTDIVNITTIEVINGTGSFVLHNVTKGEYNATVKFNGTVKFEPVENSTVFNVTQIKTNITVDVPNFSPEDDVNGTINLTDEYGNNLTANVSVIIKNSTGVVKNITVEVVNGTGSFNLTDIVAGNYNVTVKYNGTDRYIGSENSDDFNVTQIETNVTVEVPNFNPGDNVTANITLTDENGNNLSANVSVVISNGTGIVCNENIEVVNGTAAFEVPNRVAGNYNITVKYNGTDRYVGSQISAEFNVTQIKTNITIDVPDFNPGDVVNGTITLTDKDGNNLSANVTVTINNETSFDVEVVNGTGSFIVPVAVAGNYNATVKFNGTDKYVGSESSDEFNVTQIKTNVTVVVPNFNPGDNVTANITLTDELGNLSANVTVTISNGTDTIFNETIEVVNGTASFEVPNSVAGNYTVTVKYNGTDRFTACETSQEFNVTQIETTITVDVPNFNPGDDVNGTITLTDANGTGLTDNVTVTIDGNSTVVEVVNGTGSFNVPIDVAGNYTVTVKYNGTNRYVESVSSDDFNVTQIETNVVVDVPDFNPGDDVNGTITLTDANSNGLSDNVTVSISNGTDTVFNETIEIINGTGSFVVPNSVAGNYTVTVNYNGTNRYAKSENSTEFKVTKIDSNISVEIPDVYVGDNVTGNITLTDADGNGLTANVTVAINNETPFEVEVINGTGSFNLTNVVEGNYNVTVEYNGTNRYNEAENSTEFKVSQVQTNISVDVPNFNPQDDVNGTITLTDEFGNNLTGNVSVIIKNDTGVVKNITVEVVNGTGSFNLIDLVAGNYNVTVKYNGTDRLASAENSALFNVTQIPTNIVIDVPNFNVGDKVNGTITLTDANGNKLDGNVTVIVAGNTTVVEVINGTGTFAIPDLLSGEYDVSAQYNGTVRFASTESNAKFNVTQVDVILSVTVPNVYVDDNVIGNISLVDALGNKLSANVTVTVGNKNITVPVANGAGSFTISNLSAGNYTLKVKYGGTDRFSSVENSTDFAVLKYGTIVTIDVADAIYGKHIFGNVTLTDINGNKLSGTVKVTIDGKSYKLAIVDGNVFNVSVENGAGSFEHTTIPVGVHTVSVQYDGNYKYKPSSNSTKVTIVDFADVSEDNITYGVGGKVSIKFKEPINENVTVEFNGKNQTLNVTNGTTELVVPDDLAPGKYDLIIYYDNVSTKRVVTVVPEFNLTIDNVADKEVVKTGDNVTFTITVGNKGPGTFNITVTDYLDPSIYKLVSYVASNGTYDPETGIWKVGELAPNQTATLTFTVIVLTNESFVNVATLSVDGFNMTLTASAAVNVSNPEPFSPYKASDIADAVDTLKTGNPIMALLLVLLTIPILRRRR